MLRQILLCATFLISLQSFAAWGIFQTYVVLDSGNGNFFHAGGENSDGATTYSGRHYGVFNTSDTFILNGAELKTFRDLPPAASNACGGTMYYRVYKECETPGAYSSFAIPYNFDYAFPDDNNQNWQVTNSNINLLSGLSKGDYQLDIYFEATGDTNTTTDCDETDSDGSSGTPITASFTVATDGFADGDFTASPVWSGDTGSYSVLDAASLSGDGSNSNIGTGTNENTNTLVSNASTGEAAVTTPSSQAYGVWEFSVATGDNWNTSDVNNFAIILTSDTDDETKLKIGGSMDFNGYYIKLKNDAAADKFVLMKQEGTTETEILDLNYPLAANANLGYTMKVVRTTGGDWEIFADQGFDNTDATTSRGTTKDNDVTTSSYFAVSTNITTGSAARRLYFDNFMLGTGTEVGFSATSATVIETDGAQTYDLTVNISDVDDACETTADVVLVSGSAARINSYTTQSLTWAASDAASKTVTLTVSTNTTCELDETLVFELQNVSGGCEAANAPNATFTLTLEDDESGTQNNFSDDIEDGDITDWTTTGVWDAVNSAGTISGTYDLKHDNTVATSDYATKSLDNLELRGVETRWRFNLKHGGFATSATNWMMVALAGSEVDPFSATFDGYAIGVNFDTATDNFRLVRVDNGVFTDLISSSLVLTTTNDVYGVEVVRDADGLWSFSYQNGGGFDAMTGAGSTATDGVYVLANYISFAVKVTVSNSGTARIDDFSVQQYGCDETWYTVGTGNSTDAIWSENPVGTGETLNSGKFKRLVVQSGNTLTLDDDLIARDFSIDGTFNGGSDELFIYGNYVNDGTLDSQTGTITFKGEANQSILGTSGNTFNNLKIDNDGGSVTMNGDVSIKSVLSPEEGTLLLNSNDLTLISDATGTASIGEFKSGAAITGDITMQRYIPAGDQDWINIGVGLTGLDITDWNDDLVTTGFTGSDYADYPFNNIQKYDETSTGGLNIGWEETTNTSDVLSVDKGYMVFCLPATQSLDMKGGIQQGSITQAIDFTAGDGLTIDGWNLVNNKYPSAIDWDALVALSSNVSTYYIYDSETDAYLSRNGITAVGTAPQYIASGQSFWVKADAASASLQWEESIKTAAASTFERNETSLPSIEFVLQAEGYTDHAFVSFMEGATSNYENAYDAFNFGSMNPDAPALGTLDPQGYLLEQNTHGSLIEAVSIPIRIEGTAAGTFEFSVANMSNLPSSSCVTLEDTELETIDVLSEGLTWTVTLEEGEISDRFILHVGAPAIISADAVSCYGSEDGTISITSADGMFNLQWFNEMDELIESTENFSGTSTLEGVAFGNYTAVLTSDESACASVQETVYVDTPTEHELNSTHGTAYCNAEGSAYLAINFNAPEVTLNVSSNGNEVINNAYTSDVLIEELNAEVYTIDATSACSTWNFEIDLTDENALSIEVPTPGVTPVVDGQGVIVLEASIVGFGNVEWFNNGTSVGTGNVLEYSITQAGEYNFTAQVTNDTCSDQVDVVAMAESAVGIIENTSEASLVFNGNALGLAIPNETGNAQIDVFSSNGQLVESFNLNAQASVQWLLVNDLAAGVYTVQVSMNNKKLLSETFVK